MIIPFFMLKEDGSSDNAEVEKPLTLKESLSVSVKSKSFMYWMVTLSVMTVGLQLFLGGINELFSTTGLNMTVVMASSFAPVPITIMAYNAIVKKWGLGLGYKFVVSIFAIGMVILLICYAIAPIVPGIVLTLIAVFGGIFISFSLGAFFSVTYSVPTNLAQRQMNENGKSVSGMFFAVQGVFEGIAAGIATGPILTALKDYNVIYILPVIVIVCCVIAFVMSFFFPDEIKYMSKNVETSKKKKAK